MTFGPDGNLYVGDNGGEILRYDGQTGAFLDVFAETWGVNVYDLLFVPEPTLAGAPARRRGRGPAAPAVTAAETSS